MSIDDFQGVIWTAWDRKLGTRTDITYSDITVSTGKLCAHGTAHKVPYNVDSTSAYDYPGVWGAEVGWNINQPKDADSSTIDAQRVDFGE